MGRVRHPDANPITIVPARSRCDPRGDELSLPSLLGPHPSPAVPEGELDGDGDGPDRADSREPGRSVAPQTQPMVSRPQRVTSWATSTRTNRARTPATAPRQRRPSAVGHVAPRTARTPRAIGTTPGVSGARGRHPRNLTTSKGSRRRSGRHHRHADDASGSAAEGSSRARLERFGRVVAARRGTRVNACRTPHSKTRGTCSLELRR